MPEVQEVQTLPHPSHPPLPAPRPHVARLVSTRISVGRRQPQTQAPEPRPPLGADLVAFRLGLEGRVDVRHPALVGVAPAGLGDGHGHVYGALPGEQRGAPPAPQAPLRLQATSPLRAQAAMPPPGRSRRRAPRSVGGGSMGLSGGSVQGAPGRPRRRGEGGAPASADTAQAATSDDAASCATRTPRARRVTRTPKGRRSWRRGGRLVRGARPPARR